MSAGQFNTIAAGSQNVELINSDFPSYNFDVIDGIEYEIDVSQAARYDKSGNLVDVNNSRIKNITYQGEPINLTQKFLVVSNNYRASGGGNFPGISSEKIVVDAPNENRQAVADYLIFSTNENPETGFDPSADGNWSFTPLADTRVVFKGSSKDAAQTFAGENPALNYSSLDADGYGVYSLDLGPINKI